MTVRCCQPPASMCTSCSPSCSRSARDLRAFAGVVGGTALSLAPGEDVRYLLASLVVVIVGGMGSITGAAIGALLVGLAEQIGLVYLPTYGIVLTFIIMVVTLALRPQGIMGRARPAAAPVLALDRPNKALAVPAEFGTCAHRTCGRADPLSAGRFGILPHPDRRLFADLGSAGAVDDAARRLRRHGQLGADHQRRRRRLYGRDLRHQQHEHLWLRLAVLGAGAPFAVLLAAATASAIIGAISVRTEGIYTIMITLAIAAAFFYFAQQNYTLFNGHSGYAGIPAPRFCGGQLARSAAVLLFLPARRGGLLMPRCSIARARPSGSRCKRSATTAAACARSASTSPRTRWSPISTPASSPVSPACCWSGSTAGCRPARRCRPGDQVLIIAVIGGLRHPIGPFIGAVFVDADPDLRHRYRWRRTLQYADRASSFWRSCLRRRMVFWACGGN